MKKTKKINWWLIIGMAISASIAETVSGFYGVVVVCVIWILVGFLIYFVKRKHE